MCVVRTPVNEIISYLDTALEQAAGQKMRESLIKAQNASYALTDIMDDLLGLTEGEAESTLAVGETFNLKLTGKSESYDRDVILTSCSNKGPDSD